MKRFPCNDVEGKGKELKDKLHPEAQVLFASVSANTLRQQANIGIAWESINSSMIETTPFTK